MYLYKITNVETSSIYIGITKRNIKSRFNAHKCAARKGIDSYLYNAMRLYGIDKFKIECLQIYQNYEDLLRSEEYIIRYIKAAKIPNYNIRNGGSRIFGIRDEESWKKKLKEKRIDRKPALGMKHTEENKKFFGTECQRRRQEKYGLYSLDVLNCGFTESNRLFGISKTHYYRLRNRMRSNESH